MSESRSRRGSKQSEDSTKSSPATTPTTVLPYKLFLEDDIRVKEPVHLFHEWYVEAKKHKQILTPNAMCLTTCDDHGIPSARVIILSSFNKQGFQFIGNMNSRKGIELESNPLASMTFYWAHLNRSVRIHGTVEPLPMNIIKADFKRKPVESRLASLFEQGQTIKNRKVLETRAVELEKQYRDNIPIPAAWGGYMLIPRTFEFVQRHTNLIHDRIRFRRQEKDEKDTNVTKIGEDGWVYERLWP